MKKTIKERRAKNREYKDKWRDEHKEEARAKAKARRNANNTEEYRAKRRAAYAAKHANDPMTEHRRACIEAAKKRMKTPLYERKALKAQATAETAAEKAAKKDMQEDGYLQAERESERARETVIKYIRKWTKRKILWGKVIKDGDTMSDSDVRAYYREAHKYFEIQERLDKTDPKDYTTRNILRYKLRVIEEHFNALLNLRLQTKNRLKSE